ncbi:MAG: hypothetical protein QM811_05930 [Pirellulales bacterium]
MEDKGQASRDAMLVAGIVGALAGAAVGWCAATPLGFSVGWSIASWVVIGLSTGAYAGYLLADFTRRAAARTILAGNRTVLDDIGRVTAGYLDYAQRIVDRKTDCDAEFAAFLATLRPGASERDGQDLLGRAFTQYETAPRRRSAYATRSDVLRQLHGGAARTLSPATVHR